MSQTLLPAATDWLTQLRGQCQRLLAHPHLDVNESLFAVGTLLSKTQQRIDEGTLYAGLVEIIGDGLMQLADDGSLQQQASQRMPIAWFRVEALQQLTRLYPIFPVEQVSCWAAMQMSSSAITATLTLRLDEIWRQQYAHRAEALQITLLWSLIDEPAFLTPRCSFGEMFARLSRYLFWFRQVIALESLAGKPQSDTQLAQWATLFGEYGGKALTLEGSDELTSDFCLLQGLALLA
ncbi:hypothetical protein [Kluyvera sichuanensis]